MDAIPVRNSGNRVKAESDGIPSDSGNWFDPESVEVLGVEPNSGIERNLWESVRFHRDGIPGTGWN